MYCRQKANILLIYDFTVDSPVCFAISFAWFITANIVCISVSVYAFVCANIFGAVVLKPRFKIDVVIMIIWSIVIIINPLVPLRTSEYVRTMFFKMLITILLVVLFFSSLLCPIAYCRGFIFLPPQRCYPPQSLHNSWS